MRVSNSKLAFGAYLFRLQNDLAQNHHLDNREKFPYQRTVSEENSVLNKQTDKKSLDILLEDNIGRELSQALNKDKNLYGGVDFDYKEFKNTGADELIFNKQPNIDKTELSSEEFIEKRIKDLANAECPVWFWHW